MAIVTDSIACLPKDLVERYHISVIPLNFYAGGKVYRDGVDITPSGAYKLFLDDPKAFKTSAASPADCIEAYREASQHADNILCVTLSAKLSVIYDVTQNAAEQAKAEFPGTSIQVLDSQTAAAAEGFVALEAARVAEEGKDLGEVLKTAEEMRDEVDLVAYMDTIRYIYRSGRIPKVAAMAGSMLNIRPILTFSSGTPHFIGAVRNRERGLERLIEEIRKKTGNSLLHVAVMHVYAEDQAEMLKERISSEFDCAELWVTEFSPLMGYACGTGTLGVAFYPEG
ncbi:MAG: DegV family protein [Dehalococcoidales bacterium]|nr:MAG: DegV family protein [Dehalococcoidales bacterium]